MAFYIYQPANREFLADDETEWTPDIFGAAVFTSRELAEEIAVRQLGERHSAFIFDDGKD